MEDPLQPNDKTPQLPSGNAIRVEYVRALVAVVGIISAVVLSAYRADNTVVATLGTASVSAFFGYSAPPKSREDDQK